jgi:hypothetical protein
MQTCLACSGISTDASIPDWQVICSQCSERYGIVTLLHFVEKVVEEVAQQVVEETFLGLVDKKGNEVCRIFEVSHESKWTVIAVSVLNMRLLGKRFDSVSEVELYPQILDNKRVWQSMLLMEAVDLRSKIDDIPYAKEYMPYAAWMMVYKYTI